MLEASVGIVKHFRDDAPHRTAEKKSERHSLREGTGREAMHQVAWHGVHRQREAFGGKDNNADMWLSLSGDDHTEQKKNSCVLLNLTCNTAFSAAVAYHCMHSLMISLPSARGIGGENSEADAWSSLGCGREWGGVRQQPCDCKG